MAPRMGMLVWSWTGVTAWLGTAEEGSYDYGDSLDAYVGGGFVGHGFS
jgi:hypothetical protein